MAATHIQNYITVGEAARVLVGIHGWGTAWFEAAQLSDACTDRIEPDGLLFWSMVVDEIRYLKSALG